MNLIILKSITLISLFAFYAHVLSGCAGESYEYHNGFSERVDVDYPSSSYHDNTNTSAFHPVSKVDTRIGKVYATAKGTTLYTFNRDADSVSTCYGDCAESWPPFRASEHAQSWGAFSAIERKDGSYQWAYNGRPLYTWVGDRKQGDTNGHGVNSVWYAAQPLR